MKTVVHENMKIEDFNRFFISLKRDHPEILGAEWNKEKRILKVFYEDGATEIAEEDIRNLRIPTILRFKKKIAVPTISNATVTAISENEIIVECFDADAVRKEVEKKLMEYEESKNGT